MYIKLHFVGSAGPHLRPKNFVWMLLARALNFDWEEKQALFCEAMVVRPFPIGLYFVSLRELHVTVL